MHDQFIGDTMPSTEYGHQARSNSTGDDSGRDGFIECQDSVDNSCYCDEHGEVIACLLLAEMSRFFAHPTPRNEGRKPTPLRIILHRRMEDC